MTTIDWTPLLAHLDRPSALWPKKIELDDVGLQFEGKPPLFAGLNLTIDSGDVILIQGPSGSGKSSLLRLLNRLQDPTTGDVLVDGASTAEGDITRLRRALSWVQQTPVVIDGSVADNLTWAFGFDIAKRKSPPDRETLRGWLDAVLMEDVALDDDASVLSVGQQQRLSIVRALLTGPTLLLCDEPTSALDDASREIVQDWLERVNIEKGIGVVMVTHLPFTPRRARVRRLLLEAGSLIEQQSERGAEA